MQGIFFFHDIPEYCVLYVIHWASLVVQMVKNLSVMQETEV